MMLGQGYFGTRFKGRIMGHGFGFLALAFQPIDFLFEEISNSDLGMTSWAVENSPTL